MERELGLDLVDFNLYGFSHFIASNNLALGFTNDADACFSSVSLNFNPACDSGSSGGVWSAKDEDPSTYAGYVQSMDKAVREKRLSAWGVTTAPIGRLLAFQHDLAYVRRLLARAIEQSIPGRL